MTQADAESLMVGERVIGWNVRGTVRARTPKYVRIRWDTSHGQFTSRLHILDCEGVERVTTETPRAKLQRR